ncbi:glucose-6-phosphate dehydrogenase assembly protein OpcA [Catenulispora pinisilvae]|uniref:glucose-6-phosphate dehydrogenase assembly protein OpcA n=1 Tax=Catenulispora pinisilvae TaxID=2705253 RepID=UPI00189155F7|nr:glucose-6-phosphate dehydrogenase assembly protein OpcA [Catenulispora pinisilvae]
MIKHLDSTTSAKIANALIDIRKEAGAATTGAVLTLVIETDERHHYYALRAAREASRAHPSRILVVIPHPEQPFSGLDAEVRVGDEMGPGEAVVMRLNGELAAHADAVVLPLLLPDTPVVTWWPAESPEDPAASALGKLAMRRITDASGTHQPIPVADRLRGYSPGDTDLAWTRCTPWRSMLAAALDQLPATVGSVKVTAEVDNASSTLLAVWLGWRLGVPVTLSTDTGPGITGVHMGTDKGEISLTRPDGMLAVLSMPEQPDRHVALKRRELADLLTEELRRLDVDETYEEVLRHVTEQDAAAIEKMQPTAPQKSTITVTAEPDKGPLGELPKESVEREQELQNLAIDEPLGQAGAKPDDKPSDKPADKAAAKPADGAP